MAKCFTFTARILRKQVFLPRYVVVKPEFVRGRTGSFAALVSLNGSAPFARTIHPWGKGSEAFFFNLTEPQCSKAGVDTGSDCGVRVEPHDL